MSEYFIPGHKGPQTFAAEQEPKADELDSLLGDPVVMSRRGTPMNFYRIGALARALNRTPVTVRKWQDAGYIPSPSFSKPTQAMGGSRTRLYSYAQIKSARDIAAEEHILNDLSKAITHTNFAARVLEAWNELKEQQ